KATLALLVGCALCSGARAVSFDGLPAGTVFGFGRDLPGAEVHSEADGIRMSVENFVLGSSEFFFFAEVAGPATQPFATNALSLDNISVRFDFADVPFTVNEVSFEFFDLGGSSNLAVNDAPLFILNPLSTLPTNVAPGVTAIVSGGHITLVGPVQSVLIGGQELVIDNINAVPEPVSGILLTLASLACWKRRRTIR
ncbi:MAG: hypothetical protein ACE5D3_05570, partial [Candidatus Binatia bacterium]